jgi:myo-inositol-1(or 4)-monophosphatase
LVATGFPYYDYVGKEAYLKVLGELMEGTRGLRRLGSAALDLAWTAAGRFDGFFEYGLHPWDVAGGAVLVCEAGGVVTDFWGGDGFMADKTLIAGSPEMILWLHNQINIYFSRV